MLPLVITLCLLAPGTAIPVSTDPKPCCAPEVFKGNASIKGIQNNPVVGSSGSATFHFDLKNKRGALLETRYFDGHEHKVNIVGRASDNSTYIFYPESKECRRLPAFTFSNCMNSNFKFALTLQLGINPSLEVDVYTLRVENDIFQSLNLFVTKTNCVPISQTVFTSVGREWASQTDTYYDLALGIKDESVFTVPTYCEKAGVGPLTGAAKEAMEAYKERLAAFL